MINRLPNERDFRKGSFAPHAVYVLQRRMSGAPRKRQLATEERRVVKGHKETHALQQRASYSITSSARAMSVGGTWRPSALAVFRLITNSNFIGAWTGSSLGFEPLSMQRRPLSKVI
jgi:hypothetical protein